MPVGFGFSVGDFIAGINLLIDSVKSLDEAHGAKADYEGLQQQLTNLKNALDGIEALSLDETQKAAISDCRSCVDGFVRRNSAFRSLSSSHTKTGSLAAFRNGVLGVRWAILKKKDVAKFRTEVQQHCHNIHLLLAPILIKQRQKAEQRSVDHQCLTENFGVKQASLAHSIKAQHEQTKAQIDKIRQHQNDALTAQSTANSQFIANFRSLDTRLDTLKTLQEKMVGGGTTLQNRMLQILLQGLTQDDNMIRNQQQALREIQEQKIMLRESQEIPPQVLLSTPVLLLDACGRIAPFHLEFIDSAEAFVAVLKIRFKDLGLRKVETGQFALEDTRRKEILELSEPWAKTVRPGQHIGMSMIFRLQESPTTNCPSCGQENQGSNTEDVHCGNITCRLTYRRIEEASFPSDEVLASVRDRESEEGLNSDIQHRNINRPDDTTEDEIGK